MHRTIELVIRCGWIVVCSLWLCIVSLFCSYFHKICICECVCVGYDDAHCCDMYACGGAFGLATACDVGVLFRMKRASPTFSAYFQTKTACIRMRISSVHFSTCMRMSMCMCVYVYVSVGMLEKHPNSSGMCAFHTYKSTSHNRWSDSTEETLLFRLPRAMS